MKHSICIPNYNYERYLGRTIQSVLGQRDQDFEIVVADNNSSDNSMVVVQSFNDPRIKFHVNRRNVGFSANLDRAARMARGESLIMLSSDDLLLPDALETHRRFGAALGEHAAQSVVTSTWDIIDSADKVTGRQGPDRTLWTEQDRCPSLDEAAGGPVYAIPAKELLRRSLLCMRNPFNFAATYYPRSLYEAVEGYGGNRLINPDKWFHWKLLSVADHAYFIDRSLVAYRWHAQNQTAQQASSGALKYSVDEYVSTLELEDGLLTELGCTREDIIAAFIEYDVARHGLSTLARRQRRRARRIWNFGRAAYPRQMRANRNAWLLGCLLTLGVLGQEIAHWAYGRYAPSRT